MLKDSKSTKLRQDSLPLLIGKGTIAPPFPESAKGSRAAMQVGALRWWCDSASLMGGHGPFQIHHGGGQCPEANQQLPCPSILESGFNPLSFSSGPLTY